MNLPPKDFIRVSHESLWTFVPGFDRSLMPGGIEADLERRYRVEGIPVGPEHRQRLEDIAKDLGTAAPW